MQVSILDLDGSVRQQSKIAAQSRLVDMQDWGPRIRMACSFGRFRRFEQDLESQTTPAVTFCGSGDFHHVSLALVKRVPTPVNLLVVDNHPDWMRGVPFLHCGTWLYHAARLQGVNRVFHVGGDVDFDNYYQWLAPWKLLLNRRIVVMPSVRQFTRRTWLRVPIQPVRDHEGDLSGWITKCLAPFRGELEKHPLYISLDKDVMTADDAFVNWDSGHLRLAEVQTILQVFLETAQGKLAGMDVVGDWSPVRLRGSLRYLMHWTEHPSLTIDPDRARTVNEAGNLAILESVRSALP
jgi:hypothetical protein